MPIGQTVPRSSLPWVSCATADAVTHFAWGIGDNNPLWLDAAHGRQSRWGSNVAPPSFLFAVDETTVAPGCPELRRVYQSVEWRWFDVVRIGQQLEVQATLLAETEDGPDLLQTGEVRFSSDGALVARAQVVCRRTAAPMDSQLDRPEIRYDGAELSRLEQLVLAEEQQGLRPRTIDDVRVGDALGPVVKGPLSIMDVVAWCAGTQGVVSDDQQFSEGGLALECATGPQQVAWVSHAVTNWMGDDAFLAALDVEVLANPPLGSATSIAGAVVAVHDRSVHLELTASNQWDQPTATGSAVVALPSAQHGPVDVAAVHREPDR